MPCRGLTRTHYWQMCGKPESNSVSTWEVHLNTLQSHCESYDKPTGICLEVIGKRQITHSCMVLLLLSLLETLELLSTIKKISKTFWDYKNFPNPLFHSDHLPGFETWRWEVRKPPKNCTISRTRKRNIS